MPIHDWSRVGVDSFNDFHQSWLVLIRGRLNRGLLPPGYYSHIERHEGRFTPELMHTPPLAWSTRHRSTVVVRQAGSKRVVALIELASASNKDRAENAAAYVTRAKAALDAGVHVAHLDILPPTRFTPIGLGGAIWHAVQGSDYPFSPEKPLAADAFRAGRVVELFANPLAVGDELPDVPLFLSDETYVDLPLAATYAEVFASIAPDDRELLARPA
jgi:hypothetical protein